MFGEDRPFPDLGGITLGVMQEAQRRVAALERRVEEALVEPHAARERGHEHAPCRLERPVIIGGRGTPTRQRLLGRKRCRAEQRIIARLRAPRMGDIRPHVIALGILRGAGQQGEIAAIDVRMLRRVFLPPEPSLLGRGQREKLQHLGAARMRRRKKLGIRRDRDEAGTGRCPHDLDIGRAPLRAIGSMKRRHVDQRDHSALLAGASAIMIAELPRERNGQADCPHSTPWEPRKRVPI